MALWNSVCYHHLFIDGMRCAFILFLVVVHCIHTAIFHPFDVRIKWDTSEVELNKKKIQCYCFVKQEKKYISLLLLQIVYKIE